MSGTNSHKPEPQISSRRNSALTLAIICIILIAGLAATIAYYTLTINGQNDKIANLTDTANNLNDTVNLAKYMVLANNQTISQASHDYTSFTFTANTTGYLLVWILSSSPIKDKYVRVIYNSTLPTTSYEQAFGQPVTTLYRNGSWTYYSYDYQNNLTVIDNPVFPVLSSFGWSTDSSNIIPIGTTVEIRIGNTGTDNATEQVTIVYYY
jgi:hypothetical protein